MNQHLRKLLINQIKKALADSDIASEKKHPYLTGKVREILLNSLINPLLNKKYSSGTGHVVDFNGNQSKEMDICLYSNNLLPPFFHTLTDKLGMFPIESVMKCIEVKSVINKRNLKDAFDKFKYLDQTLTMTPGFHGSDEMPLSHIFTKPKFDFFAFRRESNKYTPEYILNLYKEIDPDWEENPLMTSICVANSGWVCSTIRGWYHMAYNSKSKINEEIIGYLCTLLHDLDKAEENRGSPRIGYYLSNSFEMDKIKKGKKIRNTWRNNKVGFTNTNLHELKTTTVTII